MARAVAAMGNSNDINCWSNIPYFFLKAGREQGFLNLGLPLEPKRQKTERLFWNLVAPFRRERPGGFQYTRHANEGLLKQEKLDGIKEIISFFQLFPPHELCQHHNISFSHYIDFPLPCLFDNYGVSQTIGHRTAKNALAREREQYAAAHRIICMSPWAARQVIERCGVSSEKVYSITPGANLPESAFFTQDLNSMKLSEPPDGITVPLRIAFVGRLPLRKGLDRLVEGVRILRQRRYKIVVRVVGPEKNLFPHDHEVEHIGFIHKIQEPLRLVKELQSCHIGALPSYQEAFGIAALEYLRCGLPALITKTGGLGDSLPSDCTISLDAQCTGGDIADALEKLLKDPDLFLQLRRNAFNKAKYASWSRTIQDFQMLWSSRD